MRLTARVEVNLRTKEVAQRGQGFAAEFADQIGALTAKYARENVAPGSGPGPHPHRPVPPYWKHIDTGDLMRSVKTQHVRMGFLETCQVYTEIKYGVYLELGWTSQAGNHWRYPWLMPAMMQAQNETAAIARSTARRWFSEEGRMYAGRGLSIPYIGAPISGTAWPE
jgi:hypothetical protein